MVKQSYTHKVSTFYPPPFSPRMLIRVAEALVNNLFRFLLVYVPSGNIEDFF